MTIDEKRAVLQQLAQLLQDNIGNRLTHSLISGVLATLDAVVPARPAPPDDPQQPGDAS